MLKQIICFIFLTLSIDVFSLESNSPVNKVTCSNFDKDQLELLKNTDWIPVPWTDGSCYFHNKKTKEDVSVFEEE
jgi:hypothetical protein